MTRRPSEVALGEVVKQRKEFIDVDDSTRYLRCRVRLRAQGVELRDEISGFELKTKKQQVCRSGEFLVAEIDAKLGGYGLVPPDLDGAIVSSHYFLFAIDDAYLEPRYLYWCCKTPAFLEQVQAQGSTNYAAIRPAHVLRYTIPLPGLEEQRRIVGRIEAVASRIEEARRLRRAAAPEVEALRSAMEYRIWPDECLDDAVPLSEVTAFLSRGTQSKQGESDMVLVKTQHVQMGSYVRSAMTLSEEARDKVRTDAVVQNDDILIACSAAGCLGRVARYCDDRIAATDTHVAVARPDPNRIVPDYLYAYLLGAQGQRQLRSRERGDWLREKVGFRLTELNLADLRAVPVPLPSIEEQHRIVEQFHAVRATGAALDAVQGEARSMLDAVIPSVLRQAFAGEL